MTRVHYEKAFTDYLGAPHTIWLGRGIVAVTSVGVTVAGAIVAAVAGLRSSWSP